VVGVTVARSTPQHAEPHTSRADSFWQPSPCLCFLQVPDPSHDRAGPVPLIATLLPVGPRLASPGAGVWGLGGQTARETQSDCATAPRHAVLCGWCKLGAAATCDFLSRQRCGSTAVVFAAASAPSLLVCAPSVRGLGRGGGCGGRPGAESRNGSAGKHVAAVVPSSPLCIPYHPQISSCDVSVFGKILHGKKETPPSGHQTRLQL
jgi:hypothetical protein